MSKQIDAWRGAFGDAYTERNAATEEAVERRAAAFSEILDRVAGDPPRTILEVGANIGLNLRALGRLTDARLSAVEPNGDARRTLAADAVLAAEDVHDADLSGLPFADGAFDLVFTSGVLIHVAEPELETAYRELHRTSRRYVLSLEYFSPQPTPVPYRGEDDLLFKRDYGGIWMDMFPDLRHVANGFFWKRTTGLDDLNWWLFQKP